MSTTVATRQIVISADGHCGAPIAAYQPYLDPRWHPEFEEWAASFHDGWADIGDDSERNVGVASYGARVNWDSAARLAALEAEGVVAEVLFPNTLPPFFPAGAICGGAGLPPADRRQYEQRRAGSRRTTVGSPTSAPMPLAGAPASARSS